MATTKRPSKFGTRTIHKQAAVILKKLLDADGSKISGVTLKSLVFSSPSTAKKAIYALTCETLRCPWFCSIDFFKFECISLLCITSGFDFQTFLLLKNSLQLLIRRKTEKMYGYLFLWLLMKLTCFEWVKAGLKNLELGYILIYDLLFGLVICFQ